MGEADFIALMGEAVRTGTVIAAPVLVTALLVGIAIGLLQALTAIQELTLTFVPKLAAMLVAFWLSLSFMGQGLVSLFQDRIIPMIAGG